MIFRKICAVLGVIFFFPLFPSQVFAESPLIIRALYPVPPTGEEEWILIQQLDPEASGSAVISDTHGSIKSYSFSYLPQEVWYEIKAGQSKIVLNNDSDSVVLSLPLGSEETSRVYEASSAHRGMVWAKLDTGWTWITLTDLAERREKNNWALAVDIPEEAQGEREKNIHTLSFESQVQSEKGDTSLVEPNSEDEEHESSVSGNMSSPYPAVEIELRNFDQSSSFLAQNRENQIVLSRPDYAQEIEVFENWRQQWRMSALFFLASFCCWCGLGLSQLLPWILKRQRRKWAWPLLS